MKKNNYFKLYCILILFRCTSLQSQTFDNIMIGLGNEYIINLHSARFDIKPYQNNFNAFNVSGFGSYSCISRDNKPLFSSNGFSMINKKNLTMLNSEPITIGTRGIYQASLTIRSVAEINQYHVFFGHAASSSLSQPSRSGELYNYMVDIRGDDGNSAVIRMPGDSLFRRDLLNKYTYVVSCDGYWLITKENNSPNFLSFKVSKSGLSNTPIVSNPGINLDYKSRPIYGEGTMDISYDRKKIAVSHGGAFNYLDIYSFDINTGIVSDRKQIPLSADMLYANAVQFSRETNDLYIVENNRYQFQVTKIEFNNEYKEISRSIIYKFDNFPKDDPISFYKGGANINLYMTQQNKLYFYSTSSNLFRYDPIINILETIYSRDDLNIPKLFFGNTASFPHKVTYYPTILQKTSRDTFYKCKSDPVKLHLETPLRNVVWNNQFRQDTLEITQAGTYVVSGIDDYCTYFDTVHVVDRPEPPNFEKQFDICANTSKAVILPNSFNSIYWPDDVNQDRLRLFNKPGVYPFTAKFDLCNIEDSIVIREKPKPLMLDKDMSGALSICPNGSLSSLTPLSNITWNNSLRQDTFLVSQAGQITLSGNFSGCLYADTATLVLKPINNFTDKIYSLCDGNPVIINLTNALPNSTAILDNQPPTTQWTFTNEGRYVYTLTSNGCTVKDTITIQKQDILKNLLPDTTLCNNERLAILLPSTYTNILWQDNLTINQRSISQSGTYRYSAVEFGCTIKDTFSVIISDKISLPLPQVLKLCLKDSLPTPKGLVWESVPSPLQAGTYQYSFTDSLGCVINAVTELAIVSCEPCKPTLPNIVRSGEPIKVYFNCPTTSYDLLIYDRWGNTMHKSIDVNSTNASIELNTQAWTDGVYTYYLRTKNLDEKDLSFVGTVVLVR